MAEEDDDFEERVDYVYKEMGKGADAVSYMQFLRCALGAAGAAGESMLPAPLRVELLARPRQAGGCAPTLVCGAAAHLIVCVAIHAQLVEDASEGGGRRRHL